VAVDVAVGSASRACGVRVATDATAAEAPAPVVLVDSGEASPFELQASARLSSRRSARARRSGDKAADVGLVFQVPEAGEQFFRAGLAQCLGGQRHELLFQPLVA
jgi:hypothetical protein